MKGKILMSEIEMNFSANDNSTQNIKIQNDEKDIIEILVDAINQGTKKFDYEEAPFLHEAMNQYFEWSTGMTIDDIIGDL